MLLFQALKTIILKFLLVSHCIFYDLFDILTHNISPSIYLTFCSSLLNRKARRRRREKMKRILTRIGVRELRSQSRENEAVTMTSTLDTAPVDVNERLSELRRSWSSRWVCLRAGGCVLEQVGVSWIRWVYPRANGCVSEEKNAVLKQHQIVSLFVDFCNCSHLN